MKGKEKEKMVAKREKGRERQIGRIRLKEDRERKR